MNSGGVVIKGNEHATQTLANRMCSSNENRDGGWMSPSLAIRWDRFSERIQLALRYRILER
jgi:hypothetical protein